MVQGSNFVAAIVYHHCGFRASLQALHRSSGSKPSEILGSYYGSQVSNSPWKLTSCSPLSGQSFFFTRTERAPVTLKWLVSKAESSLKCSFQRLSCCPILTKHELGDPPKLARRYTCMEMHRTQRGSLFFACKIKMKEDESSDHFTSSSEEGRPRKLTHFQSLQLMWVAHSHHSRLSAGKSCVR